MCLSTVFSGHRKRQELAKLPDMVTCWKVVRRKGNQYGSWYKPQIRRGRFLNGWNETKPQYSIRYRIAFHAFLTKESAYQWRTWCIDNKHPIIRCKTDKKDIVAIGSQNRNICIVTQRIWIPKPRKK